MAGEREPQVYQFKHPKRVSLDEYRGVGRDIIELNHPVTDGFMRTSDIRRDIVIVQKPPERTRADRQPSIKLPLLDVFDKNKMVQTRKENDTWRVVMNDKELEKKVAPSINGHKFDQAYVEAFQAQVQKWLKNILTREKLFNGGEYNAAFRKLCGIA